MLSTKYVPTKCSYHYINLKMIKLRLGEVDSLVYIPKSCKTFEEFRL